MSNLSLVKREKINLTKDNANFFKTPDLSKVSDEELYKLLLTEFPSFIKEARNKDMIK